MEKDERSFVFIWYMAKNVRSIKNKYVLSITLYKIKFKENVFSINDIIG